MASLAELLGNYGTKPSLMSTPVNQGEYNYLNTEFTGPDTSLMKSPGLWGTFTDALGSVVPNNMKDWTLIGKKDPITGVTSGGEWGTVANLGLNGLNAFMNWGNYQNMKANSEMQRSLASKTYTANANLTNSRLSDQALTAAHSRGLNDADSAAYVADRMKKYGVPTHV